MVKLEDLEKSVHSKGVLLLYEPCIYLEGRVTSVGFTGDNSHYETTSGLRVQYPIPDHRVALVINVETSTILQQQLINNPVQVPIIGSSPLRECDLNIGLGDVHALILQTMSDGTYSRLGTVIWSR